MWHFYEDRICYEPGESGFLFPDFSPDFEVFRGAVLCSERVATTYRGYDDWCGQYSVAEEMEIVTAALERVSQSGERIHIRGISQAASIDRIREYYRHRGYEDQEAKYYTLALDEPLTVSISLRHLLWCEKDKKFLGTHDISQIPYGAIVPPLRGSHDLRTIQQALRMGIIMGVELYPGDEIWLMEVLQREIIPPFALGQALCFAWKRHGFMHGKHTSRSDHRSLCAS